MRLSIIRSAEQTAGERPAGAIVRFAVITVLDPADRSPQPCLATRTSVTGGVSLLIAACLCACRPTQVAGGRSNTGGASDAASDRGDADAGGSTDTGDASIDATDASCTPLDPCACSNPGGCIGSSQCVTTMCGSGGGICADLRNGTCECGVALVDNCVKPASHCVCPSCGDYTGLCVTDAQQAMLCSGRFRAAFRCP